MKTWHIPALITLLTLGSCFPPNLDIPSLVPATSLTLSDSMSEVPSAVLLLVGASETFTAEVLPADSTDEVVWTSSSPTSVSVTQTGVVKLLAAPSQPVTITATAGSVSASFTVSLSSPATSLALYSQGPGGAYGTFIDLAFPTTVVGTDNYIIQLGAKVLPLNSTDVLEWTSSDPTKVSLLDNDPAAPDPDSSQPSASFARPAIPSAVTVTGSKFIKVIGHLTQDVVITAKAGSVTRTLTLTPMPLVLTFSTDGITFNSADNVVDGDVVVADYPTTIYFRAMVNPSDATVDWATNDVDYATIGTPTTAVGANGLVSTIAVTVQQAIPGNLGTSVITVTVGGTTSIAVDLQPGSF